MFVCVMFCFVCIMIQCESNRICLNFLWEPVQSTVALSCKCHPHKLNKSMFTFVSFQRKLMLMLKFKINCNHFNLIGSHPKTSSRKLVAGLKSTALSLLKLVLIIYISHHNHSQVPPVLSLSLRPLSTLMLSPPLVWSLPPPVFLV